MCALVFGGSYENFEAAKIHPNSSQEKSQRHNMCVNDDDMINYLFTWLHVIDSFLEEDTE